MNKERLYHYDLIRALAAICVIGIHVLDPIIPAVQQYSMQWWYLIVIQVIVRVGLPVFFVVSGALILNSREESLKSFYSRRLAKVIIPLFIYSFIYLFMYKYSWSIFKPINIVNSVKDILAGPVFYHLWFVYTIIGLYLISPFLKIMLKNLSDKLINSLFILILLIKAITIYLPIIGVSIRVDEFVFGGWILYFILGYCLTRESILNKKKCIYSLGIVSFVLTILIVAFIPRASQNIYDLAPTMIIMVCAVFVFFYDNKCYINEKQYCNKLVNIISKYSYSIYLIHAFVLAFILNDKLGINGMVINPFIGIIITIFLALIISIALSIVIDMLITNNIIRVYNILLKNFKG